MSSRKGDRSSKIIPPLSIPTEDAPKAPAPRLSSRRQEGSSSKQGNLARRTTQFRGPEALLKQHKFRKVAFKHPTWCIWSNKFIWGLDKTGFECVDCEIAVSRKFLAEAKLTVCEGLPTLSTVRAGDASKPLIAGSKIFTIHLPEGQRRSVMLNPMQKLSEIINKICRDRNWNVSDYVACDSNGNEIDLRTPLGQIKSFEITFTERQAGKASLLRPPLLSDMRAKLEAEGVLLPSKKGWRYTLEGSIKETGKSPTEHESGDESSPQSHALRQKMKVKERYDVGDNELGIGAFSTVLSATDKITGEVVAIKVIDRGDTQDDLELAKKFQQEFEIHSQLSHEHIVQFIMMDETPTQYFVVMELVSGGELFDQVIARGQFTEKDASVLICQVLTGLAYMHKKGFAHRDLKPENLLFKDQTYTSLKIADFGESKPVTGQALSTYCGTPDYMAPEIIQGLEYGVEVDMWAMGCISYIMMAGFPPFDGENDAEILASILAVKFDFPTPEWDDYGADCKDFISKLLVADRSKRLTSEQALEHPFIVKYNSEEKRKVPGKEPILLNHDKLHHDSFSESEGALPNLSAKPERASSKRKSNRRSIDFSLGKEKAETGDKSPRSSHSTFDPLDLALLQLPFVETTDGCKTQLLNAVEVLFRFAASKSIPFLCEELTTIQTIVSEIAETADKRTEFQMLVLKTYWLRLGAMKIYIQNRKEKKKSVLSKTRSRDSSRRSQIFSKDPTM